MASINKLSLTMFALWCSYAFFFMEGKNQPNKRYQEIKDPSDRVKQFLKVTPFEGTWEIDKSFAEKSTLKTKSIKSQISNTRLQYKTPEVSPEKKMEFINKKGRIKFFILKDNDLTFSMEEGTSIKFAKTWVMEMLMIDGQTLNDPMYKVDILSGEHDGKIKKIVFNDKYDDEKNKAQHEKSTGGFPNLIKITTTNNSTISKTNQINNKFQDFLRVIDYRKEPSVITKYVHRRQVFQFNCSVIAEVTYEINPEALQDKNRDLTNEVSASFRIYPKKTGIHKNCAEPIKGELRLFTKDFYNKISRYSLYMIALAMINITICVKVITKIYHGESDPHRYSIFTQIMIASMDLYIGSELIMKSFHNGAVFHFFFTPALWFFILYSALDYRVIFFIWFKNNETAQNQLPQEEYRNRIQSFGCNFGIYTFCMYALISSQAELTFGPVIICAMILTPQIILQVRKGFVLEADYPFLIFYCFSRFLFDFYFMGCPENFEEANQNYLAIAGVIIMVIIQVLLMKLQDEYGPDFLIPSFMLPVKFDYFIKVNKNGLKPKQADTSSSNLTKVLVSPDQSLDIDNAIFSVCDKSMDSNTELTTDTQITKDLDESPKTDENDDIDERLCAICMTSVLLSAEIPFDDKITSKRFVKRLNKMKDKVMKTPCGHEFHIPCLVNWMQIKMECPSCRKELPPQ